MKRVGLVSTFWAVFLLGSCSDGGRYEESFTNGGMTLTAATVSDSTNKTVTVTDASDMTVLTLVVSTTGATLSAPGETDISMTFYSALEALPTDYTASRMAVYVAGIRALNSPAAAMPDSPGCDWFPDTQCTLDCCAEHDRCYDDNNCGASSWLWGFGTTACDRCNAIAYDCIAAACVGYTESFLPDNCYDAKCNMHYDCPPDYDSCTCLDVCADLGLTIPATCGDGECTVGENPTNCWNDCVFGQRESTCQGTAWSPPGEACGVTCPTTMETPAGTWTDCVDDNSRPGCVFDVPMALLGAEGNIIQSCRLLSPSYNATGCDAECSWQNSLILNAHWYDRGKDRPTLPYADWQAAVEAISSYDIEKYGAQSLLLFSPTHWAAVSCQTPLSFGTSFPESEAQALLSQIETLSWAR